MIIKKKRQDQKKDSKGSGNSGGIYDRKKMEND